MAIIGISGKKTNGKDTVAKIIEYITDEYYHHGQISVDGYEGFLKAKDGYGNFPKGYIPHWQIKRFADKLKDIVCLLIGCTREQLEDNDFKEKELGEEWRIWYWAWYKVATSSNPEGRIGDIFVSKEEAELATSAGFKTLDVFPNAVIKTKLLTPRLLLQLIGTDCGRKIIHPNIWVNATMSGYKSTDRASKYAYRFGAGWRYMEHEIVAKDLWNKDVSNIETNTLFFDIIPNWIITDVRFPNEVKAIKDKGGIVLRVNRPSIIPTDNHESETALDSYTGWDGVILNEDMKSLIGQVSNYLTYHKIVT